MSGSQPFNSDPTDRARAWSDYWHHGALHSLPTSYQGNYEGAIKAFWSQVLAGVAGGQRMLDIGTGNGALPLLALELRAGDCPQVDAVDIATVAPEWHRTLPAPERERIRFHGDTRAEELPFPDGHFNLVASQYGFEYTDTTAAGAEAARVLCAGGTLALVMHHAGSRLHAVATAEAESAATLCADGGFLDQAGELLPWMGLAARGEMEKLRGSQQAAAARESFNASTRELNARIEASQDGLSADVRQYVFGLLQALQQRQLDADAAAAQLVAYRTQVAQAQLRSAELCRHALDEAGMDRLQSALEAAGFHDLQPGTVHHQDMLMGWTLQATRG